MSLCSRCPNPDSAKPDPFDSKEGGTVSLRGSLEMKERAKSRSPLAQGLQVRGMGGGGRDRGVCRRTDVTSTGEVEGAASCDPT
jgi:hypothetical protein